jgi:hypothetical protein
MSSLQQNWRKGQNRFSLEASGMGWVGDRWPKHCVYILINIQKLEKINISKKYLNIRLKTLKINPRSWIW